IFYRGKGQYYYPLTLESERFCTDLTLTKFRHSRRIIRYLKLSEGFVDSNGNRWIGNCSDVLSFVVTDVPALLTRIFVLAPSSDAFSGLHWYRSIRISGSCRFVFANSSCMKPYSSACPMLPWLSDIKWTRQPVRLPRRSGFSSLSSSKTYSIASLSCDA